MVASEAWAVRIEAEPSVEIRAKILAPLSAHNADRAGSCDPELVAMTIRDAGDEIVGGLRGRIGYGFLFVERLALGPAKARGL